MSPSNFLCFSHLRHHRSHTARVFDADLTSDTGPSGSHQFQTHLTENLQKLNNRDGGNACSSSKSDHLVSLTWICDTLDGVISARQFMKQALCMPTAHASSKKLAQQCMEDSVRMLDTCSLLKETLDDAHANLKACNRVLKRLQGIKQVKQGDIRRARHALLSAKKCMHAGMALGEQSQSMKRLRACSSMLRRMGGKLSTPSHTSQCEDLKTHSSMAALYRGQICTLFLRLLSTVLSSTPQGNSMTAPRRLPERPVWGPALVVLQARLHTELSPMMKTQKSGIPLLPQMATLDAFLHQIFESLLDASASDQASRDVQALIDSTSMLVDHLQSIMARLHHQLDSIAASLVDMRMSLLDLPL